MKLVRRRPALAPDARAAVERARGVARSRGHDRVRDDDLVLALAADESTVAGRALLALGFEADVSNGRLDRDALLTIGIDLDEVRSRIEDAFGPGVLDDAGANGRAPSKLTGAARDALDRAGQEARAWGCRAVRSEHLLLALAGSGPLVRQDITPNALWRAVADELED
jgi:hypothetical protein